MIRLSYRSLSIDEEKCEEKVWQSWEAFLLQLQDAAEFVNTQTPIQMSYLEDSHEVSSSYRRVIVLEDRGLPINLPSLRYICDPSDCIQDGHGCSFVSFPVFYLHS